MPSHRPSLWRRCLAPLVAALALVFLGATCSTPERGAPRGPGVVIVRQASAEALGHLGVAWYYQYGFEGEALAGCQRVRLVRPHDDPETLRRTARIYRGSWWIVGNEPNDPYQDHLSPAAYAAWYHRMARVVRAADRTAHLVPAGIANADPQWAADFGCLSGGVWSHAAGGCLERARLHPGAGP
ncbi:MAG: hypothetical protein ACYC5M_03170 [Anaerolineae bacterium]